MADQDPKYDVTDLYSSGGCEEALHVLYEYLDGELTPERRTAIERHLKDCSPCLHAFDFEAELKVTVARSCRDQVPAELRARVAAALARASDPDGAEGTEPSAEEGFGTGRSGQGHVETEST